MKGGKPLRASGSAARPFPANQPGGQSRALVPLTPKRITLDGSGRLARSATRFCASVLLRAAIVLTLIIGGAFGALHARLAHSPMSISFLVAPVERAVNSTLTGLRFDIGDAVLRSSESWLGVEFRLANVRLVDDEGSPVAESPFAAANLSLGALLSGRLAADHVDLIGPRLHLQYSDDKGLSLSFADPRDPKADIQEPASSSNPPQSSGATGAAPAIQQAPDGMIGRARGRAVSLSHGLAKALAKTRQGQSAYLTSFGIRDAYVYFDRGEQITRWMIPQAKIDLEHRGQDSDVEGTIAVQAPSESFQVSFRVKQDRNSGQITLNLGVEDLIPRAFSSEFPAFRFPGMWNMPLTVSAEMTLGGNGDILSATAKASIKKGEFYAPWDERHPALIDSGYLNVSYSREEGLIQLSDAELRWGNSHLKLNGVLQRQRETGQWAFLFGADEMVLEAPQFRLPTIPLDRMQAQGLFDPKRGAIALDRFFIQAADAHIVLAGDIVSSKGSPAIRLSGKISSMPIAFFKLIWPKFIAPGARDWIGRRIPSGRIAGGSVNIDIPADMLASLPAGGTLPPEAVDFRLNLEDLTVYYIEKMPPMQIPAGVAHVAGQRFFFTVPQAQIVAPSGEAARFTDGQFIVGDLRPHVPNGEIHFKSEAGAGAVLSLLDHPSLGYISALKMKMPEVNAKVLSSFSIAMPMVNDLKFAQIKLNGRSQLNDVRATNLPGGFGAHGGSLNFEVTESALETQGELRLNGMPVQVAWQRIFDAPSDKQPPLRLRTSIDQKGRNELGLNVDHLVRGAIPAELTVMFGEEQPKLHFELDLTQADLLVSSLGWRKNPGRRAMLTFDLEPAADDSFELKNINLQGDELAVRGSVRVDDKRQPVAFDFPALMLNEQTDMAMNGRLGPRNTWKINVKGRSYDGRRFFRSLFSVGQVAEDQPQLPQDAMDVDIDAEIDRVIGFFNTTLDKVKITAERRQNKLSALDLHGQLNGTRPLAARIKSQKGRARQISADATDAGAAFRLVGFYPSAQGGEVSLEVDLDGKAAGEMSGMLHAWNFSISEDQVVEEVLSSSKKEGPGRRPPQRNSGQLQFDRMRVPFSVGGGQFVLQDAAINGPILGATVRGAIDFQRERINLSGTYVPLYGINGILEGIPIISQIFIGRKGEGMFGITFAVRGPTSQPDVVVNPVSVVAPGFLRQLFEFDQGDTRGGQPQPQRQKFGQQGGARSSSQPPLTR
jgi:hypothetical protein